MDLLLQQPIDVFDELHRLIPGQQRNRTTEKRTQPPPEFLAKPAIFRRCRSDRRTGVAQIAKHQRVAAMDHHQVLLIDGCGVVEQRLLEHVRRTQRQPALRGQPQKTADAATMSAGIDDDEAAQPEWFTARIEPRLRVEMQAFVVETERDLDRQTTQRNPHLAAAQSVGIAQSEVTPPAEAQSRRNSF
ncbi:MAG: hypothetical protein AW09_001344 [Candidatus Accumulibacter phosphatis]|uniref:Uncharacterized protein n=1 Tax=Candidatus Accumulibacter phosphatis TaxID=327160 RepID=A0A080LXD2_9PROT|nr:MAG: hypothetical protein AW09_001344 [Candidatus Accumulibacter phosphatis]